MSNDADSLIIILEAANVAIKIENSLVCPNLNPTSQDVALDLQIGLIRNPKATGLIVTTKITNTEH